MLENKTLLQSNDSHSREPPVVWGDIIENEKGSCFIVSLRAGGSGLNLPTPI